MSDKLIDEKIKTVEKKNDEFNEKARGLQEQIKGLQKQIQSIREEQVRLQGEYRVLLELKPAEKEKKTPVDKK